MKGFKLKDVVISILIVFVTLFYFMDVYLIPEDLETVTFFGIEIGSFGFLDIKQLVYYSKMKLLILFFAITWYLTSKHWWKSAILVVITIELFKIVTALNSNNKEYDKIDYVVSLPVTIPIILLLILLSMKINKFNLAKDLRYNIDIEIDDVFFELHHINKNELAELKERFNGLKKDKNVKTYLKELILLRDKFYIK